MGVVGLARIAGMFVARGQFDELGATGVEPPTERTPTRSRTQMLGDGRTGLLEPHG